MLDSRRVAPSPSPSRWFCSSLWVLMPPQPTMQVAMLDSRVASMLDQIKAEMEDSELSIGEAPWVGVVVQLRTWPLPLLAAPRPLPPAAVPGRLPPITCASCVARSRFPPPRRGLPQA